MRGFKFFKDKSVFHCFTPEVMLATILFESALAVYTFVRYGSGLFGRLAGAILVLLAVFQTAEYHICTGVNEFFWSEIGFVAITFLPVLGYHLVSLITGKNRILKFGYALAFLFSLYFIFAPNSITEPVCTGNYVIFHTAQKLSWLFSVYYFGFLFAAAGVALKFLHSLKKTHEKNDALLWFLVGYLSFLLPMALAYMTMGLAPKTIPSIMCGFAIIFALILGLKVVPVYYANRISKN